MKRTTNKNIAHSKFRHPYREETKQGITYRARVPGKEKNSDKTISLDYKKE